VVGRGSYQESRNTETRGRKKQRLDEFDRLKKSGDLPRGISTPEQFFEQYQDIKSKKEKARVFQKEFEVEEAGILLPKMTREEAKATFHDHLEPYLSDLKKRGKTGENEKGTRQIRTRLERLARESQWNKIGDVPADSFISWRSSNENLSPRTLNYYLSEARSFLNWLLKAERILVNPLSKVSKVEEKGRATRVRRLLAMLN
jgi:hypothetical protein